MTKPVACSSPLFFLQSHTHTVFAHMHMCRLCCWNSDTLQHRVTSGWVNAELVLFLHSNKHSFVVFILSTYSHSLTSENCTRPFFTLAWPQSGQILGFKANKRKRWRRQSICLETFFFESLMAKTCHPQHRQPSLSHWPNSHQNNLTDHVCMFVCLCVQPLSIHWRLVSYDVYTVPVDVTDLITAELSQRRGLALYWSEWGRMMHIRADVCSHSSGSTPMLSSVL